MEADTNTKPFLIPHSQLYSENNQLKKFKHVRQLWGNISSEDIYEDNQRFQIICGLNRDYKEVSAKNVFPIEVFSIEIQKLILELKSTMNFPINYSGCSILYAVSVAIRNKIQLKVKKWMVQSCKGSSALTNDVMKNEKGYELCINNLYSEPPTEILQEMKILQDFTKMLKIKTFS